MAKKDAAIQAETNAPAISQFNFDLTVIFPFWDYQRGARITDDVAIQAVIDGGKLSKCVKTIRN